MDIRGDTDVVGMQFSVIEVDCQSGAVTPGAAPTIVVRDLEDILLPGGIPAFSGRPFEDSSSHVFANAFIALSPGCYDVETTPIATGAQPSADCSIAVVRNVPVIDQATTDLLVINQCAAAGTGAINIISGLNHAPIIQNVAFTSSMFGLRCGVQQVCATVLDTDFDPVELVWTATATALGFAGPRVDSTTTNADGSVTQCVSIIPQEAGRYDFTVTVYDLARRLDGEVVRIEALLVGESSHASLTFPFYSSPDGPSPAPEVCDGEDNDCDFLVDEFDPPNGVICVVTGNEDCASASVLPAGGAVQSGSTTGMTNDYGATCGAGASSPDAVYSLALANPSAVLASTEGSSFDTVLHVRTGDCGEGTQIACDDDSGTGLQSRLELSLVSGTYYFIVDGYSSTRSGNYVFSTEVVANDTCASAFALTAASSTITGNTSVLAGDHGASCGAGAASPDSAFLIEVSVPSHIHASTAGSGYDTVLHLHNGVTCDATTQLACDDDGGPGTTSQIDMDVGAGSYWLVVDGYSSTRSGAHVLSVTVTPN